MTMFHSVFVITRRTLLELIQHLDGKIYGGTKMTHIIVLVLRSSELIA